MSGVLVNDWYLAHSAIDLKFGAEGCSSDSISFHYVDAQLMARLYRLIYSCPRPSEVQGVGLRNAATPPATAVLGI